MENLAKEYRYKTNQIITKKELEKLVNDLLDVEWEIKNAMNFTIKVNLREQGWVMGWTNKKRAVGTCFGGNAKRVAMSLPYFERNDDLAHDLEQTARHEIAHALDYYDRGISDHSCYWKSLAEQVLAKPERLTSAFSTPEGRYEAFCPNCGERSISHKLPIESRSSLRQRS